MLTIKNLQKTYDNGVRALDGIDLSIDRGLFGLLGPNGAGKSSLMRTLATLQDPDEGSARFGDLDMLANKDGVRRILGYLPQEFGVYPKVSAEKLLSHFAILKGITQPGERKESVRALLELTNLWHVKDQALGTFSGGMRQRFGIAQALLGNPELIIVDEPTASLDPEERRRFLNLLASVGEDAVVILSTHIVADVRELCSSMAVMAKGKVVLQGRPEELVAELDGRVWQQIDHQPSGEPQPGVQVLSTHLRGGRPVARIRSDERPGPECAPVPANLEDVYFSALSAA